MMNLLKCLQKVIEISEQCAIWCMFRWESFAEMPNMFMLSEKKTYIFTTSFSFNKQIKSLLTRVKKLA